MILPDNLESIRREESEEQANIGKEPVGYATENSPQ